MPVLDQVQRFPQRESFGVMHEREIATEPEPAERSVLDILPEDVVEGGKTAFDVMGKLGFDVMGKLGFVDSRPASIASWMPGRTTAPTSAPGCARTTRRAGRNFSSTRTRRARGARARPNLRPRLSLPIGPGRGTRFPPA